MLLKYIGMTASTVYYQLNAFAQPAPHKQLKQRIADVARQSSFTYGYRRIWWVLRHDGITIGEKVVRRLMHEMDIAVYPRRKKLRHSSYHGELTPAP